MFNELITSLKDSSGWTSIQKRRPKLAAALLAMFVVRVENESGRKFLLKNLEEKRFRDSSETKSDFRQFLDQVRVG